MLELIDSGVESARSRYRVFNSGLLILVRSVTEQRRSAIRDLEARIVALRDESVREQRRYTSYIVEQIKSEARTTFNTELPDDVLMLVEQETASFAGAMSSQHARDADEALRFVRRFLIEVSRLARQNEWNPIYAAMQARESNRAQGGYLDRAGRRWDSERYIEVVTRTFFTDLFNEIGRALLLGRGDTIASVSSENPRYDGVTVALTRSEERADFNYEQSREAIFHPNGKSILVPV